MIEICMVLWNLLCKKHATKAFAMVLLLCICAFCIYVSALVVPGQAYRSALPRESRSVRSSAGVVAILTTPPMHPAPTPIGTVAVAPVVETAEAVPLPTPQPPLAQNTPDCSTPASVSQSTNQSLPHESGKEKTPAGKPHPQATPVVAMTPTPVVAITPTPLVGLTPVVTPTEISTPVPTPIVIPTPMTGVTPTPVLPGIPTPTPQAVPPGMPTPVPVPTSAAAELSLYGIFPPVLPRLEGTPASTPVPTEAITPPAGAPPATVTAVASPTITPGVVSTPGVIPHKHYQVHPDYRSPSKGTLPCTGSDGASSSNQGQ